VLPYHPSAQKKDGDEQQQEGQGVGCDLYTFGNG